VYLVVILFVRFFFPFYPRSILFSSLVRRSDGSSAVTKEKPADVKIDVGTPEAPLSYVEDLIGLQMFIYFSLAVYYSFSHLPSYLQCCWWSSLSLLPDAWLPHLCGLQWIWVGHQDIA
jgi:hypothetical protein